MNTSTSFSISKLITTIIAVAVIVGSGAFYGGIKYTESKNYQTADFSARGETSPTWGGQNLSPEERQQRFQGLGANVGDAFGDHERGNGFRGGRFGSGADGSRPLTGEIISQGDDSLTIKLSDGSTKIVFVSDNTQITKSVESVLGDLTTGEQIFVGGTENPDGSYTANTIQLQSLLNDHQ